MAIKIIYDLSADGVDRKISLLEQLKVFDLHNINVNLPLYTENNKNMSILFIIGFILGDGILHLR
jgi:hypothetical protein